MFTSLINVDVTEAAEDTLVNIEGGFVFVDHFEVVFVLDTEIDWMRIFGETSGDQSEELLHLLVEVIHLFVVCHPALILIRIQNLVVNSHPLIQPIKLHHRHHHSININTISQTLQQGISVHLPLVSLAQLNTVRLSRHARPHLGLLLSRLPHILFGRLLILLLIEQVSEVLAFEKL